MTLTHTFTAGTLAILFLGVTACVNAPEPAPETSAIGEATNTTPHVARAYGSVLQRDLKTRILEITHSPVPDADWPIMQMEFYVSDDIELSGYVPGDSVEFVFNYAIDQTPVIIAIRRASPLELMGAISPDANQDRNSETE